MSSLSRALKVLIPSNNNTEKRSNIFSLFNGYTANSTATSINNINALSLPAYYCGVNQIANDIAKLPKGVFKKTGNTRQGVDHSIKFLINKEPNTLMTAFMFHFIMMQAVINRGNAVAQIVRNPSTGKIIALVFIHPDDIRDIQVIDGKQWYYTNSGVLQSSDVIHVLGYSTNGITGQSVISYAAETLGIAKSAQSFTASNFENKGLGFGVVETDKEIKNGVKQNIESAINSKLTAKGKIKTVMLDEGMSYKPITLNMQEVQLIEQGKFSVLDIARFLNISPRKLKDYSTNNYASAYQDSSDHILDSLQPYIIKWQQEYDRKLFTPIEKKDHYTRFNDSILLRGDLSAKGVYYNQMIFSGIMSRNEIRRLEELNDVEGLDGHLTPVNTLIPEQLEKNLKDEK